MANQRTIHAAASYLLSQSNRHDKSSLYIDKNSRPFVTISREAGAGGTTVGEFLVEYLNVNDTLSGFKWTLFDKNLIERVIEDYNMPPEFRHFLTEERVSEMQDTFEHLMGLHPGISKLTAKVCNTILNLASMGNVVIIGRGSNYLTRNLPHGLHVRLFADIDWRIKHISEIFGFDKKKTIEYINTEDLKRSEYVKKLFNRKVDDPLGYDMMIRTSSISFMDAAEVIGAHVLRMRTEIKLGLPHEQSI